MAAVEVQLIPPTLPAGFCPQTEQERLNAYFDGAKVVIPTGINDIFKSESEPPADQRSKIWQKVDANGITVRLFYYSTYFGKWISPHPTPAGSQSRQLWVGNESDLWSYDGGDGVNPATTAPTATTGAMWEVDHSFDARMPIGVGTLDEKVLKPGDTGGSVSVEIKKTNLPAEGIGLPDKVVGQPGSGGTFSLNGDSDTDFKYVPTTENMGDGEPLNVVNPYVAAYFIKRTARAHYTP